jgi:hypothetical protein
MPGGVTLLRVLARARLFTLKPHGPYTRIQANARAPADLNRAFFGRKSTRLHARAGGCHFARADHNERTPTPFRPRTRTEFSPSRAGGVSFCTR